MLNPSLTVSGPGERLARIRAAATKLSLLERFVVASRFAAGMPDREIARILSIPERTISQRLNQALDSMRRDCSDQMPAGLEEEQIGLALVSGAQAPSELSARIERAIRATIAL